MKKDHWKDWRKGLLLPLLALALVLGGCADDGDDGAPGAPGGNLINAAASTPETLATLDPVVEITRVTVNSPPVVHFTVTDAKTGLPISGLGAFVASDSRYFRFTLAKLVPGTNGNPSSWVAYTRDTLNNGATEPDYDTGTLVDNGDGTYRFTYATDIRAVSGVPYQAGLTHRVAGQMGNGSIALKSVNFAYDFVPAGGNVTQTREIAMTASCNECHGELTIHGRRTELKYCVTCHNPDLAEGEGDMAYMVHFIHNASGAFSVLNDGWDVSGVLMPTGFDVRNCMKCHNGADAATPNANNWQFVAHKAACEGCHTDAHSTTMTDNSGCVGCHSASGVAGAVEMSHRTNFSTENNPEVPAWARILKYEIDSVTANASNQPVVKFRILIKQNSTDPFVPLDLAPASLTAAGIVGSSPAFRIAWGLPFAGGNDPIDGPAIAAPADWNNHFNPNNPRQYFGPIYGAPGAVTNTATGLFAYDQPSNITVTAARDLAANAGVTMDADGWYTYTLTSTPFPADATRRGVALEAGFQFNNGTANVTLQAPAVIKEVGTPRRQIVSQEKCAACHERLALHGGSRVMNPDQCVICHNAEITNSGSGTVTGGALAGTYGQVSNNLKDMVHAAHAGAIRSTPYKFIRGSVNPATGAGGGGGAGTYDFSHITFFDREAECTACHLDGTYMPEAVPATASWSTFYAAPVLPAAPPAVASANWNPSANWRFAPNYAACFSCHDTAAAQSHFDANLSTDRNGNITETCVTCHASGRSADVEVVHGLK